MIYELAFGAPLPLCFQTFDYNATKYVRVFLRDEEDELIGSYDLLPDGTLGLYLNDSQTMPDTNFVTAQYIVYDDSGYTMVSGSEGGSVDVFILNNLDVGQFLPVYFQTFDYDDEKFVKAYLRDTNGNELPESPLILEPIGAFGLYGNRTLEAPSTFFLSAQYIVYDDADYLDVSESEGAGIDTFRINGQSQPLMTATLPYMGDALRGYFQPMVFEILVTSLEAFKVVSVPRIFNFKGVWKPFSAQKLNMQPQGQRAWRWYTLHSQTCLELKPDDIVKYLGTNYRVMEKFDYSPYGFFRYHLVEDYRGLGL